MTDSEQKALPRPAFRPNMPVTLAVVVIFMVLTAAFDFLALITLYKDVPASGQMVGYRALITANWIFFLLFMLAIAVSIAWELPRRREKPIAYVELGSPRPARIIILSAIFFIGLLLGVYLGDVLTSYLVIMPPYFLLFVWSLWFSLIAIWVFLVITVQLYYMKRKLTRQANND
jgi:magnesium-transporting ATPase (P-type)